MLRAKGGLSSAVALNTGVCGAVLIVVEVVLVLVYQIVEGSVYRQMALIISLFMAGLAAGSALVRTLRGGGATRLFMIQTGLAAYLGVLYLLFSVFRSSVLDNLGHDSMLLLFSALAFLAGMFGGGQFCAAVAASEKARGAGLYAADLIGASAGAVAGSLFFLPVLGIPKTLLILGFGCLAARRHTFEKIRTRVIRRRRQIPGISLPHPAHLPSLREMEVTLNPVRVITGFLHPGQMVFSAGWPGMLPIYTKLRPSSLAFFQAASRVDTGVGSMLLSL